MYSSSNNFLALNGQAVGFGSSPSFLSGAWFFMNVPFLWALLHILDYASVASHTCTALPAASIHILH